MNIAVRTASTQRHRVTLTIPYDAADVEKAAESLDIPVCDEEVNAILDDIGAELTVLAASAARSAVLARIYDDVRRVSQGHEATDDD